MTSIKREIKEDESIQSRLTGQQNSKEKIAWTQKPTLSLRVTPSLSYHEAFFKLPPKHLKLMKQESSFSVQKDLARQFFKSFPLLHLIYDFFRQAAQHKTQGSGEPGVFSICDVNA